MKQGWEEQYFGNCFKLKSGDNLTAKNMSENGIYPVFGGNGIAGYHNEYNLSGSNVIIGRVGALCGNVRHIIEKIWLTDNAFRIVDFKFDFDHSYLTYLLNYYDLRSYARQSAQPVISNSSLKDVILRFPKSIKEQQRIVSILDECFAAIDKALQNAKVCLSLSKALFESYLQGVFEKKGDDWEEKKLGEFAEIEYGYTDKAKAEGDFRYIRITDIDNEGLLSDKEKVFISSNVDAESFSLNDNDLLMARTGATFAKVLLYEDKEPSIFASYLIRIKFSGKVDNKFYWYFSKSPIYWEQARLLSSGAAQPQFNGNALKQVVFTFPKSLAEQQTIVRQLDALRAETQKLEAVYQKKIADLEELKKSILQKAFAGELRSPEGAEYDSEAVTPLAANDGYSPSKKNKSPERT